MKLYRSFIFIMCLSLRAYGMSSDQRDFFDAVENGDIPKAERLYRKGVDLNYRPNSTGETPLHKAASHGQVAMVEALLGWGANPLLTDNYERKPLEPCECDCLGYCDCPQGDWPALARLEQNAIKERGGSGTTALKVLKKKDDAH